VKVLIVSHSYITAMAQRKLAALTQNENIELTVVVPTWWRDALRNIPLEKRYDPGYRIVAGRVAFSGRVNGHFYWPAALLAVKDFAPDVLHIEQEPTSLAAFEWLVFNSLRARARTVLFTWENLAVRRSTPQRLIESFSLRQLDHVIAGNRAAETLLRCKHFTRPITVMPLVGVDADQFAPMDASVLRHSLGLNGARVVGYLGRLVGEKGLPDLLEAVAPLAADVKLLIIGKGPLRSTLEMQTTQLNIRERVVFIGTVPHDAVVGYLNCMDVLVLPSRTMPIWAEQFGHVLIEAMACGVAVIGSNSGAIPEVIDEAGLLFREGDVAGLRAALMRLLNDASLRTTLAARGRERVRTEYTNAVLARKTIDLYRDLIA
jgi:glycosyltransferase involved in cell wall biosynthesis